MSCVVVIPARGGSVGIPKKNLQPINGVPLLARAIRTARRAISVNRIVVSTDDMDIAALARKESAEVVIRPAELCSDSASSESALLHASDTLNFMHDDLLIMMQCTSPFTLPSDLDLLVDTLHREQADCAFTVTPFHGFVWRKGKSGAAIAINHDPSQIRERRQDRPPEYVENGAAYLCKAAGFWKHKNRFFSKTAMVEMPNARSFDIDTPEDLALANEQLAKMPALASLCP